MWRVVKNAQKRRKPFFKDIPSWYVEAGAPAEFKIPDNGYLTAFASQQVNSLGDLSLVKGNDYLVVIGQCGVSKTAHLPGRAHIKPFVSFGDMNDLFSSIPEPVRRTLNVHVMGPGFNVFGDMPPNKISLGDFWTQFNSLFFKVTTTSAADCPSYSVLEWRELFAVAEQKYKKINMLHLVAIAQFFLTRYDSSFHSFASMFGMNGLDQLKFELDVATKLLTECPNEKLWTQSVITKLDNMLVEQACSFKKANKINDKTLYSYVENLTAYKLITGKLKTEEFDELLRKARYDDTFWLWKGVTDEEKRTFKQQMTEDKIKTIRQFLKNKCDFTSQNVKIYTLVEICPTKTPSAEQLLEINRKLKVINACKKNSNSR